MQNFEKNNDTLSMKEEIELIINKSKQEQDELESEIDPNTKKIGGYEITNKFDGFLDSKEKGFAIILSEDKAGVDDLNVGIIIKYEKGKITIRDTQQEPFGDAEYDEIDLKKDEQIEGNDEVNKINKLISSRGFETIKGDELKKLAEKIESLKK